MTEAILRNYPQNFWSFGISKIDGHAMNLKQSTLLSYFGECSVAIEALQVSCMVDCNSLWYENLDDRKCLQGTNIFVKRDK